MKKNKFKLLNLNPKNFSMLLKTQFKKTTSKIYAFDSVKAVYRLWKKKLTSLKKRLSSTFDLFKTRKQENFDDFFFALEDLPMFGKEYWFLYFVDSDYSKKLQFILTAGRAANPVKVNKNKINYENSEDIKTAAVCWLFDTQKKVLIDGITNLTQNNEGKPETKKELLFVNNDYEINVHGNYPNIEIKIKKNNSNKNSELYAQLKCHERNSKFKIDMVELLKNSLIKNFGAVWLNYYLEYEGSIEGKLTKGNAYLQKVVAITPLAPWNWVRIEFSKNCIFDMFMIKPIGDSNSTISYQTAYLEYDNKRYTLKDIALLGYGKRGQKNWIVFSKDFYMTLKTYSFMPFVLQDKTKFNYDEYLVEVVDVHFVNEKFKSINSIGKGIGIVEDAFGYLL